MKKVIYLVMALAICSCGKKENEEPKGNFSFKIENVAGAPSTSAVSTVGLCQEVKGGTSQIFAKEQWNGSSVSFNLTLDKYPALKSIPEALDANTQDFTITISNPSVQMAALNAIFGLSSADKTVGAFFMKNGEERTNVYTAILAYVTDDVTVVAIRNKDQWKGADLDLKKGWNMIYVNMLEGLLVTAKPANLTWMYISNK